MHVTPDIVKLDIVSAQNRLLVLLDMTPCEALVWVTVTKSKGNTVSYPIPVKDTKYSIRDLVKSGVAYPSVCTTVLAYDVIQSQYIMFTVCDSFLARELRKAFTSNQSVVFNRCAIKGTAISQFTVSTESIKQDSIFDLAKNKRVAFDEAHLSLYGNLRLFELFDLWRKEYSDVTLNSIINSMPVCIKYIVLKHWTSYLRGPV